MASLRSITCKTRSDVCFELNHFFWISFSQMMDLRAAACAARERGRARGRPETAKGPQAPGRGAGEAFLQLETGQQPRR
jgi:hypothetical protein